MSIANRSFKDPAQRSILESIGSPNFDGDRSVESMRVVAETKGVIPVVKNDPVPTTVFLTTDLEEAFEMFGVFARGELTGTR